MLQNSMNDKVNNMKRSQIEYLTFASGIAFALFKYLYDNINLDKNIYLETAKILTLLVVIVLILNVLYSLQQIPSKDILFRCHADEGLFCVILLPIAFLFNCIHYNDLISSIYKILTVILIEMSFTSIMLLFYAKKHNKYLLLLLINLITISVFTKIMKLSNIILIFSIICQILFIWLQHTMSVVFSKSFTIGELHFLCQGIVLFITASAFHFYKFTIITSNDSLHEVNTVISITLMGLLLIFLSIKTIPILKIPIYFYIVCCFIEVSLTFIIMHIALKQNPLFWLFNYLLNSHVRILLVCYLFISIASTIAFMIWQITIGKSSKLKRKIFHIIIVIVYIPGFYIDAELLLLSSAGMIAVFLTLECIRILNIPPLGKVIHDSFNLFLDEKDCGLLIVSHIYLLVGSTISLWINPHQQLTLSIMSGILSIGFGDSVAAVIGILWGKHKWYDSSKTYEGTISALFAQYIVTLLIFYYTNKIMFNIYNSIYILIVTCFSVLFEALTTQFDNLILPLFLYIMLIFI